MAKGQSAEHSREVTSRQGRERPEMQLGGTMGEKERTDYEKGEKSSK